jgi:hypothetical protein
MDVLERELALYMCNGKLISIVVHLEFGLRRSMICMAVSFSHEMIISDG